MVNVNGDLSRVSNNVRQQIDDIANQDGRKGISSSEERNALADLLSSGKVTGKSNQEYIQGEINKFDLNEAKKNASDFVKKAISNAMKMTGDKNSIDDNTELAVLDSIIDNTNGEYSAEDVQYAKLIKEQSSYARTKSDVATLKEENSILQEKNAELMKENKELKAELEAMKQEVGSASKEFDDACKNLTDIPDNAKAVINDMKGDLGTISNICTETSKLADELQDKQKLAQEGKLSKTTFDNYKKQVKAKINDNKQKIEKKKADMREKAKKASSLHPKIATVISAIKILGGAIAVGKVGAKAGAKIKSGADVATMTGVADIKVGAKAARKVVE